VDNSARASNANRYHPASPPPGEAEHEPPCEAAQAVAAEASAPKQAKLVLASLILVAAVANLNLRSRTSRCRQSDWRSTRRKRL